MRQFLGSHLGREVWRRSRSYKQHQVIKDKFCQADLIKTLDQITQVGDEVLALSRKGWNCFVMKGLVLQQLLAELREMNRTAQGRSGEQQYAVLGGKSSHQDLHKGSAEENTTRFFTEAVRHVDLGLLPSLTCWCCVQSPDPDGAWVQKMACAV